MSKAISKMVRKWQTQQAMGQDFPKEASDHILRARTEIRELCMVEQSAISEDVQTKKLARALGSLLHAQHQLDALVEEIKNAIGD